MLWMRCAAQGRNKQTDVIIMLKRERTLLFNNYNTNSK
jgi:hypothetical protein